MWAPRVTCALTNPGAHPELAGGRRLQKKARRLGAGSGVGGREETNGYPNVLSSGVALVEWKFSVVGLSFGFRFEGCVSEELDGKASRFSSGSLGSNLA